MDPRRKKIYIIIIVVCLVFSVGILGWSYFSNPSSSTPDVSTTPQPGGIEDLGSLSEGGGYNAPTVFPNSTTFRREVMDSQAFKKLRPYTAVDVTGQLGRPDPFRSY
jgi:hypothetical protein